MGNVAENKNEQLADKEQRGRNDDDQVDDNHVVNNEVVDIADPKTYPNIVDMVVAT